MKKLIVVLIVLLNAGFVYHSQAWNPLTVTGGGAPAAAPTCDTCDSGNLIWSWHMEDTTIDNDADTPCGCATSGGDNEVTLTGTGTVLSSTEYTDGDESVYFPSGNRYAVVAVSSNDVIQDTAGTLVMDIYIDTHASYGELFRYQYDGENTIRLYTGSTASPNIDLYFQHNGESGGASSQGGYINCNIDEGVWYTVFLKWDTTAHSGNYLSGRVELQSNGSQEGDEFTDSDAIHGFDNPATEFRLGESAGISQISYIDNIQIYDAWIADPR